MKDTISKTYHAYLQGRFRRGGGRAARPTSSRPGSRYRYMLIDDAAAQVMKQRGRLALGAAATTTATCSRTWWPPASAAWG
ncbi:MAG: hypothetical protein MZV70_75740 [Desulfobacterales bacterium]|nr:hypothetical protein [Desulfobacterales bacterium]